MKKRKILAIAVLIALCLSAMTGAYALPEWAQSIADRRDGHLVDMEETLEITWWGFNENGILPKDDTIMQQIIEQRFNIEVTNVQVDNYNAEQVNLLLATGVEFDICTNARSFSEMAETGLIREVDPEMIRTYAPTITSFLEEELGDSWTEYCEYDGAYWGIPQITASWSSPNAMGIRTDWLAAIGYDESNLPTTMEGLEEMLLKLHTDDPDGNGEDDTYALGVSNSYGFYEFGAFGVAKNYWYYNADGELMTYEIDPNYKEVLKLMNRWYELGIYDPEIITDTRSDGVSKFATGVIAGYTSLDNTFALNTPVNLSGPGAAASEGKDITCTLIPPMEGCYTTRYSNPATPSGVTFGYNCSDEKLIRLLQIQDTFFSDLDLWLCDLYGEKGVHWDMDENGNVITGVENGFEEAPAYEDWGTQRFYNFSFMPSSVLAWRLGGVGEPYSRYEIFQEVKDFAVIEPAPVTVFTTEADMEYGASCQKIRDEYFLKAITGEVDIDATFDDFVNQWLAAGGQEILDAKRALAAE